MQQMLRTFRIIFAILFLAAVSLIFLDNTGFAAEYLGWTAKIQVIPALLSFNAVAIALLVILTIIFGRIYCSVICPLGVTQDIFTRIGTLFASKTKRRIGRFKFRREHKILRYTVFAIFAVMLILGLTNLIAASLATLVEPYSFYGRLASGFYAPLYDWLNNLLADWSIREDNFLFDYAHRSVMPSVILIITALSATAVIVTAVITGREYCNSFCPVGTLLGMLSRHSLLHPVINIDMCNGCRSCERHCKAGCIDSKTHTIDLSRCISCMDCVSHCSQKALTFARHPRKTAIAAPKNDLKSLVRKAETKPSSEGNVKPAEASRRNFLTIVGLASGAAIASAAESINDGGLTPIIGKSTPVRETRIIPPGTVSYTHLSRHCVGCQLCVQQCPQDIIKTSFDVETFMQPYIDFTDGFCLPECTRCSEICPAGAFHPLDTAEKSSTKIGTASVDLDTCLYVKGIKCGNCARHCPAEAITIVSVDGDEENPHKMPIVDFERCIGCGSCEYHCPVGNVASTGSKYAAIRINGLSVQRTV